MAEAHGDTATLGVVSVQLGLVEILGQVEEEPGDVADQVHDHYRCQGPGGLEPTAPALSLERKIDGGVGDHEEEYRQQPGGQGSGPVDVVVDVVRAQPQRGRVDVPDLLGDVFVVRHVDGDQLQLKELRNVE